MTSPPDRGGIYALTIARPVATTMVTLAIATFGWISFKKIPLELLPEIDYPSVTVRTEFPGAGPEDIEERISKKVEEALAILPGLVSHRSISRSGLSDVVLEFQWGKPLTLATQEIRERLDRANLPDDVETPLVLRYDPALDPVLRIAVFGDDDLAATRLAAEEIIARGIGTVQGVAAVRTRGGLETEIRVRLDNTKLSQLNLDISEVDRKLRIENVNLASGKLIEGDTEYLVRTLNEFQDLDEILELGIAQRGGQPIRLRDVATVERTAKERDVVTRVSGRESVELLVFREADANIVSLSAEVKRRLFGYPEEQEWLADIAAGRIDDPQTKLEAALLEAERAAGDSTRKEEPKEGAKGDGSRVEREEQEDSAEIRELRALVARKRAALNNLAAKLPRGVEVRVLSDQAVFIENAIQEVKGAALLGGLLSVLVLLLFLRDLGGTALISVSIPISIIATFACMFMLDTTLNIMSLGGLALGIGMLVDNSIVVLESIVRCREEGDDAQGGALRGTKEVGAAVIASTLTTVAVFFPIAFVSGVAGQIFKDQALTVVFSVSSSLFVALLFLPMLAARVPTATTAGKGQPRVGRRDVLAQPLAFLGNMFGPVAMPARLLAVRGARERWSRSRGFRRALAALALPLDLVHAVSELLARLAMGLLATVVYAVVAAVRLVLRALAFASIPVAMLFDRCYGALAAVYPGVLRFALRTRWRMSVLLAASAVVAWLSFDRLDRLGTEMLPEVHQGEVIAHLEFPVGTPVERTAAAVLPIEEAIRGIEGVASVSASIGIARDEVAGVDEGSHSARLLVGLDAAHRVAPTDERAAAEEKIIEGIRKILSNRADLATFQFSRPALFSIKAPLEIEAHGEDLDELRAAATELARRLSAAEGLHDVRSTVGRGNPEIRLTLDREKMLRFGLDIEAISNRIRAQVQGVVSTRYAEGERRIDIRVKSDIETVDDLLNLTVNRGRAVDLADTLDRGSEGGGGSSGTGSSRSADRTFFPGITIDLGSNAPIPLSQIAEVRIIEGPSEIRRIAGQRAAVVSANTSGFDVGAALDSIRREMIDVERSHPGITCSIGGQGAEMGEALDEMKIITLLAIFLVYLVMAAQFESIVQPLVIMVTIPLALVGVIGGLAVTGTPLSIVALIGIVVLAGIVVNNAIVLLDYTNQLRARGVPVREALVTAGSARLRPILMTAATTILGLVPLTGVLERIPGVTALPVYLWAGSELQFPLAVSVIGGLTLSTVLTLVVIPALYALVEMRGEKAKAPAET